MNDRRESQCIKLASDAKLAVAKRGLTDLDNRRFSGPLDGFSWRPVAPRSIKHLLLLPIAFLAILALVLLTPLVYVYHLWSLYKGRSVLKREIQRLSVTAEADPPRTTTIEALWEYCGLDDSALTRDERLALLESWVVTLYGAGRASTIDFEDRLREIASRHCAANQAYCEGRDAPHFYFSPAIEVLVRQLSHELPPFTRAA